MTGTGAPGSQGKTVSEYAIETDGSALRSTVKITDAAGRWKKQWTDGFGDLVRVTEPKPGGGEYSTTYTYTALGALNTVTMIRDGYKNGVAGNYTQNRTFVYSNDGTLQQTVFPETGTTSYAYDNGRLYEQTDAAGRKRRWVYESGRLKRIERYYAGVERVSERTVYVYDPYGRLQSVSYGNANVRSPLTENYAWTWAGQLQYKELVHPWGALRVSWTYNEDGTPKTMKYPLGGTFDLGYDASGRMNKLEQPGTPEYDPVRGTRSRC